MDASETVPGRGPAFAGPGTWLKENLISNLKAQQLALTDADMQRIDALERNGREVSPEGLAPEWD